MRPILFSGPMIRAILDGRKCQTRRVLKPQPSEVPPGWKFDAYNGGPNWNFWDERGRMCNSVQGDRKDSCQWKSPYEVGMRLWVRETWHQHYEGGVMGGRPCYRADEKCKDTVIIGWRPSIFMPRWASRITLEVTAVRVERLGEISEEDAKAEGATPSIVGSDLDHLKYRAGFITLWNSINGKKHPWLENPWVFVISFKTISAIQRGGKEGR